MYTRLQLAKKYLEYYFKAASRKGHGVHSPFVFDFIKHVLRDRKQYDCYGPIERRRIELLADKKAIEVEDFGAGSSLIKSNTRVVKNIAASSLKPKRFAQLIFRIVQYYKPGTVVELGTSLGITSSYLACGNPAAKVYTCEGAASIAALAEQTFQSLQLHNIELIRGDFAATFPSLLNRTGEVDVAFIDGNHRKEPTLQYFHQLLAKTTKQSILIFDDIHWSNDMEAAWVEIQQHPAVTLTIDLFFIGLVFVNPDFKVKQHFKIRF